MSELTSHGTSATERPERYGSQLVKHFTHKDLEGGWEDDHGFVTFGAGRAEFQAEPGVLKLRVIAGDEDGLAKLRDVVERHLVRFGQRDELAVTWEN